MAKFRKKPVIVDADPYTLGLEDGFALWGQAMVEGLNTDSFVQPECAAFKGVPYIKTLEGHHFISEGDWIITGVQGERYPCKPDIFKETHEPAEDSDAD